MQHSRVSILPAFPESTSILFSAAIFKFWRVLIGAFIEKMKYTVVLSDFPCLIGLSELVDKIPKFLQTRRKVIKMRTSVMKEYTVLTQGQITATVRAKKQRKKCQNFGRRMLLSVEE
jgi:hypothetical protein